MMIHNTFKALEDEYHTSLSFKEHTINSLLQILLVYIQRCVPSAPASQASQTLIAKLNEAIAHNHYALAKPTFYAKKLNTSVRLLNKATSEVADQSLGQYIRNQTLQEAKRLLSFETMTCNEVAYCLGFSDPAYFSRFFKREVGVAPKIFRNES
jgi:AraC-like DNA-binding protein